MHANVAHNTPVNCTSSLSSVLKPQTPALSMTGLGQVPGVISSNGRALRDRSLAAAHKEPSVVQTQMHWILHMSPKEPGPAPHQP